MAKNDESGQILVFGSQPINEPGTEAGPIEFVGADIEHHIALANVDTVLEVGPPADDLGELEQELRSIVVMQERPDRFRPIRTRRLLLHSCLVKQPGSPPRVAGYYTF